MTRAKAAARPAVADRGELALILEGQELVLRPSHEAIDAFETATGKGLLQLAREAIAGTLRLGETAQIAAECIRAWGRATEDRGSAGVNARRIADLILEGEGGYKVALTTVTAVLAMASTGGYTAAGELKPATTTTA